MQQEFKPKPSIFGYVIPEMKQSWTESRVKELRGDSDSIVIDKLLGYDEEDLKTVIDYADTLPFYIWGASRICKLAKEARRLKEERIRQQQKEERIKMDFQKLILNPSEKNMEVVDALYKKDSYLMESVVSVQKECPLLFEGEDIVDLFKNDTLLVRDLLQYYNNNKEQCKLLLESLCTIESVVVANRTIEGFYKAIPSPVLIAIVQLLPPPGSSSWFDRF